MSEQGTEVGLSQPNPEVVGHSEKKIQDDKSGEGLQGKLEVNQLTSASSPPTGASANSTSAPQSTSPILPPAQGQHPPITQLPLLSQTPNFPGAFPLHQIQLLQHAAGSGQGQHPTTPGNLVVGEALLDQDGRYLHPQALQHLQMLGNATLKQKLPTKNDPSVQSGSSAASPGGVSNSPLVDPLKKKGRGGKRAGAGRKRKRQDIPPGAQGLAGSVSSQDVLASPTQGLGQGVVNNVGGLGGSSGSYSKISSPQAPVSPRAVGSGNNTLPPAPSILSMQEEEAALKTLLSSVANFQQNLQKYTKDNGPSNSTTSPNHDPNSPTSKQRRHDDLQKLEEQNRDLDQRLKECFQLLQGNASLNLNLNNKLKALETHVKDLQIALQEKEDNEKNLLQQKKELDRKVLELEMELNILKKINENK